MKKIISTICAVVMLFGSFSNVVCFANTSSTAANYIANTLKAQDKILYVFNDAADGLNNFTQRAFLKIERGLTS